LSYERRVARYYRASPDGRTALRRYVESLWEGALEAFAADDPARPPRETSRETR
jgi:hypothetical protein